MEKKYELTEETMEFNGCNLHRIKALKDFSDVKKGDLGGWVESEDNLSQEGNCWLYGNSKVCANGLVKKNAIVKGISSIMNNSIISGNAELYGNVVTSSRTRISGNAELNGDITITGHVTIKDDVMITGKVALSRNVYLYSNATIESTLGNEILQIHNSGYIGTNAYITTETDLIAIMIDGAYHRPIHLTFYKAKDKDIYTSINHHSSISLSEFEKGIRDDAEKTMFFDPSNDPFRKSLLPNILFSTICLVKDYFGIKE